MGAQNLLPDRIRVVVNAVRQDLRNVRLAVTATRRSGFSTSTRGGHAPAESSGPTRGRARLPKSPPDADSTAPANEPAVQGVAYFSRSGIEIEIGPDETILQAGLDAGVDLLFSCGLGGCGACMLTCTEGEVEYDDFEATCLLEEDVEDGYCLACVGRPRGRIVLDA